MLTTAEIAEVLIETAAPWVGKRKPRIEVEGRYCAVAYRFPWGRLVRTADLFDSALYDHVIVGAAFDEPRLPAVTRVGGRQLFSTEDPRWIRRERGHWRTAFRRRRFTEWTPEALATALARQAQITSRILMDMRVLPIDDEVRPLLPLPRLWWLRWLPPRLRGRWVYMLTDKLNRSPGDARAEAATLALCASPDPRMRSEGAWVVCEVVKPSQRLWDAAMGLLDRPDNRAWVWVIDMVVINEERATVTELERCLAAARSLPDPTLPYTVSQIEALQEELEGRRARGGRRD